MLGRREEEPVRVDEEAEEELHGVDVQLGRLHRVARRAPQPRDVRVDLAPRHLAHVVDLLAIEPGPEDAQAPPPDRERRRRLPARSELREVRLDERLVLAGAFTTFGAGFRACFFLTCLPEIPQSTPPRHGRQLKEKESPEKTL